MTEQDRAEKLRASREEHQARQVKRRAAIDHDALRAQALQQMASDRQPPPHDLQASAEPAAIVPPHPTADAAVDVVPPFASGELGIDF